jgi:acetyl esterase/lipase
MPQHENIDQESLEPLAALYKALPGGFNAIPDIHARRSTLNDMLAVRMEDLPANENVLFEDRSVPAHEGGPDLGVRIYHPANVSSPRPGILFIHGGGMVLGTLDTGHGTAIMLCETLGAVIVSVDYRLAPEHPAPAAIEDCYAGLKWMASHTDELGINPVNHLTVYGGSAGGGLAIAVCLISHERGGPKIHFLMAPYPMIDDRNVTPSSHAIVDIGIWDRAGNIEAWEWYLGGQPADQYSAPTRARDLTGIPQTFIDVGDQDIFLDESIEFVNRLKDAKVPVEMHVYPGAYHASEIIAPSAELSQRIWARRISALQKALA